MVGELKHDNLTNQLLDYFMGEMDQNGLKGLQYIFSLHIVLGNYDQATKVASQIATQEQVRLCQLNPLEFFPNIYNIIQIY